MMGCTDTCVLRSAIQKETMNGYERSMKVLFTAAPWGLLNRLPSCCGATDYVGNGSPAPSAPPPSAPAAAERTKALINFSNSYTSARLEAAVLTWLNWLALM